MPLGVRRRFGPRGSQTVHRLSLGWSYHGSRTFLARGDGIGESQDLGQMVQDLRFPLKLFSCFFFKVIFSF